MNPTSSDNTNSTGLLQDANFPSGIIKGRMLAADITQKAGDMYFINSDGIFQRLPAGTAGQVLEVVNGIPTWTTSSGGNATTLNGYPANPTPTANNIPVLDANAALFANGWFTAIGSWTYASADNPTGVITVPSGAASYYGVGDRIKITQTTVKYFIVTAVTDTTLTVYGGTDFTLADAAISAMYYSHVKSPLGFPTNPAKWSITTTDTNLQSQATPTQNTVYNLGSISITIPIGVWNVFWKSTGRITAATAITLQFKGGLSTANNSFSSDALCDGFYTSLDINMNSHIGIALTQLSLAAKTVYYLNGAALTISATAISLNGAGDMGNTIIKAVCAYL